MADVCVCIHSENHPSLNERLTIIIMMTGTRVVVGREYIPTWVCDFVCVGADRERGFGILWVT
jgi:hypothetical protein